MACSNSLPTACLLTLLVLLQLALGVPAAPSVVASAKFVSPALYPAQAKLSAGALGYNGMNAYGAASGYGPGAMALGKYGGAAGLLGYGGMGLAGGYPGGPYGLGAGQYGMIGAGQYGMGGVGQYGMGGGAGYLYGKSAAMYGGGLAATYGGAGAYKKQPYGMYPNLGKRYGAVAAQFPGLSGSGMYGKYAHAGGVGGATYMNQAGHGLGAVTGIVGSRYGNAYPPGYMTPYGGQQLGGYGPAGYAAQKQVVPAGYGSVSMLGKTLTPYG